MKKMAVLMTMVAVLAGMAFGAEVIDRTIPGIISGSSQFNAVEAPPALFDQYVQTKWLATATTGWVKYEFLNGQAFAINSYALTSANDAPDRDPKVWVLEGSTDGTNWTVVDSRSGETWSARYQRRVFKCANTTPYPIYRLNVTQNNGSGNLMQIAELELIENGVSRTAYGNVTWSSQIGWNEGGLRAFDKLTGSKWLTAGGQTTGWLQYEFLGEGAYAVNGYAITSANDAPGRDPRDWTLQGSHDGVTWTIIDTRTGQYWAEAGDEHRFERHEFLFDNDVAYAFYKLDITANNGDGTLMGFAELELLERQLPGAAQYISPAEIAFEVPVDAVLEWQTGADPNDELVTWDAIVGHYVYLGTSPDQMTLLTPTALPVATTTYAPVLETDQTYYWQIEEALEANSAARPAGDPNNVMGRVWRFSTVTSIVVINPETPEDAFAFPGESASFSILATDPLAGTIEYQWFFDPDPAVDGDEVSLVEGSKYQGANSATLTITDVQDADKGGYFCSATNSTGVIVYSSTANLFVKKLLAHWTLDAADYDGTNYVDVTGNGNNAAVDGIPVFADGFADGDENPANAVANGAVVMADPNSCANAGPFNPSEETSQFSVTAWVKLQGTEEIAFSMIAAKRDGWTTGDESYWQFMAVDNGSLRMQSQGLTTVNSAGNLITQDEWHQAVVTYADNIARLYADGMQVGVGNFVPANKPTATFYIGRNDQLNERFDGTLDDIKVFNYALSPEEVVDLFYAETGTSTCLYGNPVADLNEDCDVNLSDFAIMASNWLEHGFYPSRP